MHHQNHESHRYVLETLVDWISNMATSKMYILRIIQILKNNNFTLHDYLPQFCSENRNWLSYIDGYTHFENVNDDAG